MYPAQIRMTPHLGRVAFRLFTLWGLLAAWLLWSMFK
jgi:hypothetical protein